MNAKVRVVCILTVLVLTGSLFVVRSMQERGLPVVNEMEEFDLGKFDLGAGWGGIGVRVANLKTVGEGGLPQGETNGGEMDKENGAYDDNSWGSLVERQDDIEGEGDLEAGDDGEELDKNEEQGGDDEELEDGADQNDDTEQDEDARATPEASAEYADLDGMEYDSDTTRTNKSV